MKKIRVDMTGQQFGELTVIDFSHRDSWGKAHWNARCSCGVIKTVNGYDVRLGYIISCGHVHAEKLAASRTKHGHAKKYAKTRTYRCWRNMLSRCYDISSDRYINYGGRGIRVCDSWRESFSAFLADMGECPPDLTLERDDVNGDYGPSNCRWATWEEQRTNTTRTKYSAAQADAIRRAFNGQRGQIKALAAEHGLDRYTVTRICKAKVMR